MNEDLFDTFSRTTYMVSTLSASNSFRFRKCTWEGPHSLLLEYNTINWVSKDSFYDIYVVLSKYDLIKCQWLEDTLTDSASKIVELWPCAEVWGSVTKAKMSSCCQEPYWRSQNIEDRLFKQSLAIVEQNCVLTYLKFSWIFFPNISFCDQCQGGRKLSGEGDLFNENNSLIESTLLAYNRGFG